MTITPSGLPAWARTNDHTAYGGDLNKQNYMGKGAVNPKTDLTAENICRIAEDLAALARVAVFARGNLTCNDTSPAAPTVNSYRAMAGSTPTVSRGGDGSAVITFDDSYSDAYGVSHDIDFSHAQVTPYGSSESYATWELDDSTSNGKKNRLTVNIFDSAGNGLTDAQFCFSIA